MKLESGTIHKAIDNLTENLKKYALSGYDLNVIQPNIRLTMSYDLHKMNFADELVNRQGLGVILWNDTKNLGHYLGVIRYKHNRTFEIYDPYAFKFNQINQKLKARMGVPPRHLTDLIRRSGYKVVFNRKRLQKDDENSCGRYVLLRLALYHLNNKQYNDYLKKIKIKYRLNPQEVAMLYTYNKLGK